MRFLVFAAAAVLFALPASAQNTSLRAPEWAQALIAADIAPTTGGRLLLSGDGINAAVRITIAPIHGGVARVVRYEARGAATQIAVRRFTGHSATGWWLWGSDTPLMKSAPAPARDEIAGLLRAAMGVSTAISTNSPSTGAGCAERAFVEMTLEGRSLSMARDCVSAGDPVGRLALRVSELGGSRTEEELAAAAVAEVMDADRAFARMAAAEGVPAAFARYAAHDALMVSTRGITAGQEAIVARFVAWPAGARLEWTPETGRVSSRGDMAWTWGNSVYVAPGGARTPGRYVSVWSRDFDGNWRFSFDAALGD